MKTLFLTLSLIFASVSEAAAQKVLVVLSSEDKITLKNGITHPTGFFLSELMIPVIALKQAGYQLIFANPKGNTPVMDKVSDSAFWFGNDETYYRRVRSAYENLAEIKKPQRLSDILRQNPEEFAGIFLPGGHAPMEDLLKDRELGKLLHYFHSAGKPTALICHAPIALLSTLPNPESFVKRLAEGETQIPSPWIYRGYQMTSFSTAEEQQEEPGGQDNALGGFVRFYPDVALKAAGGLVTVASKWRSHVVRDRELITGQNPMSDTALAAAFLQALREAR